MKPQYKLFFAIPFDSSTRNQYERVASEIRKQYPSVTTVIGNSETGPSPGYSDIETFKNQNRELTEQFTEQIRSADIVIADLTHNNPNVHVELGIALTQNKNILRVTGRSISELGFDIQNLEVFQYKNEEALIKKIIGYLKIFFKIKTLPISNDYPSLFFKEPLTLKLRAAEKQIDVQSNCPTTFVMRDGAVRVDFEILHANKPEDWFGVLFRSGIDPFIGSHLVYVRKNGLIEIAVYPGPRILNTSGKKLTIKGKQTLMIEFENDYLSAKIGNKTLVTNRLIYQVPGRVFQAAWGTNVDVHSVEMICRDTIEW
jgi:hypothetical protein